MSLALFFSVGVAHAESGDDAPFGLTDLRVVYQSDFEDESDKLREWSHTPRETTPFGERAFLGRFGSESVSLQLSDLPKHKLLYVEFDLMLMSSWDGSQQYWGPDLWELAVANGPKLIETTFSNCQPIGSDEQAYPDNYPGPPHACWAGASETQTLGYFFPPSSNVAFDSVYRVRAVCPHSDERLVLHFAARYTDRKSDQQWGLENLRVAVAPKLPRPDAKEIEGNWEALGSNDPSQAVDAMWRLAVAGDLLVRYVENKLELKNPEVGFGKILDRSADSWRIRRARRLLGLLNSPEAERARWLLNAPGRYVENPRYVGGLMTP